jgi:hypothetical protein
MPAYGFAGAVWLGAWPHDACVEDDAEDDCDVIPLSAETTGSAIVCGSVLNNDTCFGCCASETTAEAATIDANRAADETGCPDVSIVYIGCAETPCIAVRYGDWLAAKPCVRCATESNSGAIGNAL